MITTGVSAGQIQAPTTAPASTSSSSFFGDVWDTINPLQHIPIVSDIYRYATDTAISPMANIAGSTIYGGPIGGAIAIAQEGLTSVGHALFGTSKTATASAVAPSTQAALAPAAGAISAPAQATSHAHKFHATTKDWLNQNLNNVETADNSGTQALNNTAASAYKKASVLTNDWLHPIALAANNPKTA